MKRTGIGAMVLACLGLTAGELVAQVAAPSARSAGLAGAYTARARGYEAVFWNPANLGLPEGSAWSVGLPSVSAFVANNSLTYGQITDLYGDFLDDSEKSALLADVRRDDPNRMLTLDGRIDAHWLGFSIGRFAIAGGSIGSGTAELTPDAVELVLFGNAGEDGTGKDFSLEGSQALGWGVSAVGVSYGHPLAIPILEELGMNVSVGATAKDLIAHGLGRVLDQGSLFTQEPLALNASAEALYSDDAFSGSGWSIDVAGAMKWNNLTAGLALHNLVGNIGWDESAFELELLSVTADFDSTTSEDTVFTFAELSPEDQERVRTFLDDADLPTRVRLGGRLDLTSMLSLSADYEERIGGSLRAGWDRRFVTGAELRALPFLPLRIGLGTNFEDFTYAGGFGVYAGPVHLDLAVRRQGIPGGDGVAAAFSVSVWPGTGH